MKKITTLNDIKNAIEKSGLTKCESQDCNNCEFGLKSPQFKELGNNNICILLNDIFRTSNKFDKENI